jgi:hypothetical protein
MSPTGTAITLVLGLVAAACSSGGGTLESNEVGIVGFHDFTSGQDKSFGIFVCASGGDIELDSVEAISSDGQIELLGAIVRESSVGFVGADNGFPPAALAGTEFVEITGAVVSTPCEEAAPEMRTQVVVGVSRTGSSGGIIEGVRIKHGNGSLDVDGYVIILCGDAMERCEDFAPEG